MQKNKSAVVREAYAKFGLEATASQVREFAKTQGVEDVQSGLISNIRSALRNNKTTKTAKAPKTTVNNSVVMETLTSARDLIARCGGVENAKTLIGMLSS